MCGVHMRNPAVGGAGMGKVVLQNPAGLVSFQPEEVSFGGIFVVCYCANYDTNLDLDNDACSEYRDYSCYTIICVYIHIYIHIHIHVSILIQIIKQ